MELYHIINRSIEGRNLFLDSQDYARFVHALFEFNNMRPANNTRRSSTVDIGCRPLPRKRLVDIHGWCLMKDHYHLLLSERIEGGARLFMRKLNVGYAKYYNERHKRSGFVLRGKTSRIHIEQNAHFLYVLHYIHLNPLDYLSGAQEWRIRAKGAVRSTEEALKYLQGYRWSSYLDYLGKENVPSILTTNFFRHTLGNYRQSLSEYLMDTKNDPPPYQME